MSKRIISVLLSLILICSLVSCGNNSGRAANDLNNVRNVYEVFVYSFCDSDGDGIGDLKGVISKLDYIKDMGYDAIWLMPIMPSETYHKYDVDDYYSIDPAYGTMDDFDSLINECDSRGMKVIIELMMNHSSDTNKWFTEACDALKNGTESKYIDYYNFAKKDEIPENQTYYAVDGTDYWYEGDFWEEMPDLNFDSEDLRNEFKDIAKFWIDKGVGGFRLDAAMHVYHETDKNMELFNWFINYCKEINPGFYIIGEIWTSSDTVAKYYQGGFDTLFNFAFGTGNGEIAYKSANGYGNIFAQNLEKWQKDIRANNPNAIDGVFLTNHDNDRIADKFSDEPELLRLSASIYMTMPGTVFTYYGEEIGMRGSGRDENKRGPMYWSATDKSGMCSGPEAMEVDTASDKAVDEQLSDDGSLLNFYKKLLAIRNKYPQLSKGEVIAENVGNDVVCAYSLSYDQKVITVFHNFSSEEQIVDTERNILEAVDCGAGAPSTVDGKLVLPPHSTAIVE